MKNTHRILRMALIGVTACTLGVIAVSCGAPQATETEGTETLPDGGMSIGTESFGLSKCNGGTNGQSDYCSSTCICNQGEGDCDHDSDCASGLVCSGKGLNFCFSTPVNVCAPAHCRDKVKDADETEPDCGGSCGTCCATNTCENLPALGAAGHCTGACPCADLQGGCAKGTQCTSGVCAQGAGAYVGFASTIGVCIAATCSNQMQDGDETGVDCGGSCLPCSLAATYGGTGSGAKNDVILGAVYDSAGDLYIAGRTSSGSINFGTGALTNHGNSDIFLAKFDKNGKALWSKIIGGSGADGDAGVAIALDLQQRVILVGNFYTTVDFGGGAVTANGTSDAFVAKYTPAGAYVWAKHYGGTGGNKAEGVVTDTQGNIIITGAYQNTINFGGSTFTAASAGMTNVWDIFVAKLNPSGVHVWSKSFGGTSTDEGVAVARDGSNNVYVAGFFSASVDFGTGSTLTSAGSTDALGLALAASNGAPLWADQWGSTTDDRADTVAWGLNSNVIFSGYFKHSATFGGTTDMSAGASDVFVAAAATSSGSITWSKAFGGASADIGQAVAVRSDGEVAVAGTYQGSVNFGGGSRTSAGSTDIFLVYLSSAGAYASDSVFGGTGGDQTNALAVTPGFVTMGGQFASPTIAFGGRNFSDTTAQDAFWARETF